MTQRPTAFLNARLVDPASGWDGDGALLIRDGRIAEVREYVDSLYAQRKLFDPAGMVSPLDRDDRGNDQ